jgi:hypothetical protein
MLNIVEFSQTLDRFREYINEFSTQLEKTIKRSSISKPLFSHQAQALFDIAGA